MKITIFFKIYYLKKIKGFWRSIHCYLSYGHPKTIKKENKQDFDIF